MTHNAWGRFKAMCPSIHPSCYFIYRVWACSRGGLGCHKPNQKRPIMLCVLWHAPLLDDVFSDIPLKNGPLEIDNMNLASRQKVVFAKDQTDLQQHYLPPPPPTGCDLKKFNKDSFLALSEHWAASPTQTHPYCECESQQKRQSHVVRREKGVESLELDGVARVACCPLAAAAAASPLMWEVRVLLLLSQMSLLPISVAK